MSNLNESSTDNKFWDALGLSVLTLPKARQAVETILDVNTYHAGLEKDVSKRKIRLSPGLIGEAGIGKTEVFKQIARDRGWGYMAVYLQIVQPEDVGGYPFLSEDKTHFDMVSNKAIKDFVDNNPEGGIIVFEELNRASPPTAAAAFAVLDTRKFGNIELPDNIHICLAQNPAGGEYAVNETENDHAFRRRVKWMCVREDVAAWLSHAESSGFHEMVVEYIRTNSSHLLDARARSASKVYASPAAWEEVSTLLQACEELRGPLANHLDALGDTIESMVGLGMSDNLVDFIVNRELIMSPTDVLEKYTKTNMTEKVVRAMDEGATDKVTDLITNVVRDLFSYKPTPTRTLAGNLGKFMLDLPAELRGQFISELTEQASARGNDDDSEYFMEVQGVLKTDKNYVKAFHGQSSTIDRVRNEVMGG